MRMYPIAIVILIVVISGCASGGGTGKRPETNTETGAVVDAAPITTVATPGRVVPAPLPAGPGAAPETKVAGANAAPGVVGTTAKAAPGSGPHKKSRAAGPVVGGLASGAVRAYMDSQKQDLQKTLRDEIQSGCARVDKLPHNVVRIRMPSQTAFDTNASSIKQGFYSTMDKVADVVIRYGKTKLTVVGHTDGGGRAKRDEKLSEQRALSIVQYLQSKDVNSARLTTIGKGEVDPAPANGAVSGRKSSRGVEIIVEPVVAK